MGVPHRPLLYGRTRVHAPTSLVLWASALLVCTTHTAVAALKAFSYEITATYTTSILVLSILEHLPRNDIGVYLNIDSIAVVI